MSDKNPGEVLVIVEYCRYGNLQCYVTKSRNHFINQFDSQGNLMSRFIHNSTTTESAQSDVNYFVVGCASSSIDKPNGEYENGPSSADDAASKQIRHKSKETNQCDSSSVSSEEVASGTSEFTYEQQQQNNDKFYHQVIEMNRECITSDFNQTIASIESNQEEIGLDFDPQECPDWSMKYKAADQQTNDEVLMGDNVIFISTRDLICWSFQIARGMNFLASKKVLLREQNSLHSPEQFIQRIFC